jgi:ATP-dependent Clp protease adapter protein ClpS
MTNTSLSSRRWRLQVVSAPEVDLQTLERLRAQFMRPWKVVLHNDDLHTFYEVADALVKSVPGLCAQEAWRITMEAHNQGRAVVTACAREGAELYKERLETFGLTVTLEQDE